MSNWSGKAASYRQSRASVCAGTLPFIYEWLEPGVVADIGCGCGDLTAALAKAGHHVTATDADPDMVAMTLSLIESHQVSYRATVRVDVLPELGGYGRNLYDNAVANFVINHVEQPLASMRTLREIVRPGGRVITTIWTNSFLPHRDLVANAIAEFGAPPSAPRHGLHLDHEFERTAQGLAELNRLAGLEPLQATNVEWTWRISWADFWLGMTAGIGSTGEAFLNQNTEVQAAIKQRVRAECEQYMDEAGTLHLPSSAALVVATKSTP